MDRPRLCADAARASVTPHTIHLELAASRAEGVFDPILNLALSVEMAADLAALLAQAVDRAREMRASVTAIVPQQ